MLKSKIHRARVTDANVNYEGSITIDRKLMEAADLLEYEQVDVVNVNNGARFTTYVIEGEKGEICINGAAARLAVRGDVVIILSYRQLSEEDASRSLPRLVYVDANNEIVEMKQGHRVMTLQEA
jgi:aspartate 1-decarboxylase